LGVKEPPVASIVVVAPMSNRVVITGLGIVSPIGIGVGEFWKAALAGRSGISAIRSFGEFPLETYRSRVAGQILDFNPAQ
jgi:3-oxoacyl-[acyl-carrier-protein] synthase II